MKIKTNLKRMKDRERYFELIEEKYRRGGFFMNQDELNFLANKLGKCLGDDLRRFRRYNCDVKEIIENCNNK